MREGSGSVITRHSRGGSSRYTATNGAKEMRRTKRTSSLGGGPVKPQGLGVSLALSVFAKMPLCQRDVRDKTDRTRFDDPYLVGRTRSAPNRGTRRRQKSVPTLLLLFCQLLSGFSAREMENFLRLARERSLG